MRYGAVQIAAAVRSASTTAADVLDEHERAAGKHEDLRAFITADWAGARERARELDRRVASGADAGPLAGVPISVKDVIAVAGLPLTCASRSLRSGIAAVTAPVVQRLIDAGAIVVGKTNCPEFAFGITCESPIAGATRNPTAPGFSTGGSSGGDAAAVAAGMVALGVGTDFGGSVRWPAQCTGLVGLRPTAGGVSQDGQVPGAGGNTARVSMPRPAPTLQGELQVIGPLARTVDDLALVWSVMSGQDVPAAPGPLRIAWSDGRAIGPVRGEVADAVARAAGVLAGRGHAVSERPSLFDGCLEPYNALRAVEPQHEHLAAVAGRENLVSPAVLDTLLASLRSDSGAVLRARERALLARDAALEVFENTDVVILPVAPGPACDMDGRLSVDGAVLSGWELMAHCRAVTMTGAPAVSVPVATSAEGLPLSVQVVAAPGREDLALAVARELHGGP